jgi:hypothetical protein
MPRLRRLAIAGALAAAPALARAQTPASPPPAEPVPTSTAPATPAGASAMEMRHAMGSGWAELDAFHEVLAATWHPASERRDLAPARARAGELARRARAMAASRAPASTPAGCRAPATTRLTRLVARDAQAFARVAAASSTSDARLTASLRGVHDRFHAVEARCEPPHEGAAEHRH